jgi:translocation and assembly module TamB
MNRTLPRVLAVIVVFLLLAWGAVYVITDTDWGREQVRKRLVALIQGNSHGIVKIGKLTGNLFDGFTAHDLLITDSAGHPFIKVETVSAAYSLRTLFGSKIDFSQVQLVRPVIVLDKQPGGRWNWDRIFPRDTMTKNGPRKTGWGTWIRFSDVTVVDGDLTVRSPWEVDTRLVGAEKNDALRKATGPQGRLRIEQVAGGYQKISLFHHITGKLPLLRLTDPGYPNSLIEVQKLSMIAEIFRPPVADVRSMTGNFSFTSDSVWWKGANLVLPATHAVGDGEYHIANGDMRLRLHADPVSPNDVRWVEPALPTQGNGKLDFALDWKGGTSTYTATNADLQLAQSHIAGKMTVVINDSITFHDANLKFANLDTRMVERIFPSIKLPRQGIASGRAAFDGSIRWLRINGDVAFYSPQSGRSHVIGGGQLGYVNGVFSARDLKLRMLPMTMDLFEAITAVNTPLGGTLSGTATLNGSTASMMTAQGDVTHVENGAASHATGRAGFRTHGVKYFDVNARVHPLALATAGRFVPSLGLRGFASGPVRLVGTLKDFRVNSELTFNDGGYLNVVGTLDLAGRAKAYNLDLRSRLFNANAVIAKAPRTSVTAVAHAQGRGTDLATMNATITADVAASSVDTLSIDRANVRVAIANGLARFDTLAVEVPQGILEAKGSFGLVPGRSGQLTYHVAIDSLSRIAALVTPDTTPVPPRPGILARRIAKAKADSARVDRATEVERAVTGRALPKFPVDTPAVVRMNELAGSVRADGVATGNIRNFSLKGTASGKAIVARGNTVGAFTADYTWNNARTPQSQVSINGRALAVRAMGFDLDSVSGKITYQKPNGTAQIVVNQDNERTYSATAQYTLDKIRNTLQLNDLKLKFDTTTWESTRVAALHWGQAGYDIQHLELKNGANGRIYVNGTLPTTGSASLELSVQNFDVQDIIAITQTDIQAKGLISLDVRATGTTADPRFKGAFGATNLVYNGTTVPEVHGTVDYANQTLTGRAEAMREGKQPFVIAEGTIPINLALTGVTGSRFPADRQIALNVNADSLPLDLIPQLSDVVANIKGDATGNFKLTGTLNHPTLSGDFSLARGSAKLVPIGVTVHDIYASIRMLRDTVVIDSIVGQAKGRLALYGGVGIGSLREPSFDLRFDAQNALMLDNDKGTLRGDASLAMSGPFKEAHITGDVRIRDGVVYIPPSDDKNVIGAGDPALFSVLDTAVVANKELFPNQSPLFANLRMDVALRVDRDVFVRSREANVEVYSDGDLGIHVNRAKQALVLDGVLLSERGEYTFMTRRFNIKRGSATFINSAELNPTLQVTGEYEVRLPAREAINIQIVIGGTLNNPNISLQSDAQPPIAQSDLLSYLAFGRSSSSLVQLEGSGLTNGTSGPGNVIGAGASLASRQLAGVALGVFADQLAGEAARSLGADVFNITPADVQTDVGSFLKGTEVEFGKYIKSHTFIATKTRLDPGSLNRPGFQLQHRFGGNRGYSLEASLETRYLLHEPTLAPQTVGTTSALGIFLVRNWRF